MQKVFLGGKNTEWQMNDLNIREKLVSALLVIAIVWLGLFPKPVLETAKPAILKTLTNQKEVNDQNRSNVTIFYPLPNLPPRGKESPLPQFKLRWLGQD